MNIINLTPHTVVITDGDTTLATFPSSGVARVQCHYIFQDDIEGVPSVCTEFGAVENLPHPQDGTFLIVSGMTADAALRENPDRRDLLTPAMPVRDEDGRVIGCRALNRARP